VTPTLQPLLSNKKTGVLPGKVWLYSFRNRRLLITNEGKKYHYACVIGRSPTQQLDQICNGGCNPALHNGNCNPALLNQNIFYLFYQSESCTLRKPRASGDRINVWSHL